jgi:hypothetical protein
MRKSDFRSDRDFNSAPDFDDPYEVKLAWQKHIQKLWLQAADQAPDFLRNIPHEDPNRWWTCPDSLPPHVQKARLKKLMGG